MKNHSYVRGGISFIVITLLVSILSFDVKGVVVMGWDSFNASTATYPVAANDLDTAMDSAGLSIANLTGVSFGTTLVLSDWHTGSVVDTTEYLSIDGSINSAYQVDFTALKFNVNTTGVGLNIHVRSSYDGYFADIGSPVAVTEAYPNYQTYTVDLSSLPTLTGNVGFRLYGTDPNPIGNWLTAVNSASVPGGGFIGLEGTPSAVPEPHEYALVFGLGLAGFAAYRRFALKAA